MVGINAPTSQSFLNYVFLMIVYGTILLYRRKPLKVLINNLICSLCISHFY